MCPVLCFSLLRWSGTSDENRCTLCVHFLFLKKQKQSDDCHGCGRCSCRDIYYFGLGTGFNIRSIIYSSNQNPSLLLYDVAFSPLIVLYNRFALMTSSVENLLINVDKLLKLLKRLQKSYERVVVI